MDQWSLMFIMSLQINQHDQCEKDPISRRVLIGRVSHRTSVRPSDSRLDLEILDRVTMATTINSLKSKDTLCCFSLICMKKVITMFQSDGATVSEKGRGSVGVGSR